MKIMNLFRGRKRKESSQQEQEERRPKKQRMKGGDGETPNAGSPQGETNGAILEDQEVKQGSDDQPSNREYGETISGEKKQKREEHGEHDEPIEVREESGARPSKVKEMSLKKHIRRRNGAETSEENSRESHEETISRDKTRKRKADGEHDEPNEVKKSRKGDWEITLVVEDSRPIRTQPRLDRQETRPIRRMPRVRRNPIEGRETSIRNRTEPSEVEEKSWEEHIKERNGAERSKKNRREPGEEPIEKATPTVSQS